MRASSAWVALLSLMLPATAARADEREWLLVLEPTLAVYQTTAGGQDTTAVGAGGSAVAWFGLTSAAWLFASVGAAAHVDEAPVVGEAVGGLALALDVLRAVPFVDVGLGGSLVDGEAVPVLRLGVGLDYLVTSHVLVGAVARYRPAFGRGDEDWWTVSLRLGWRDEL